jgi:hypothetical protein
VSIGGATYFFPAKKVKNLSFDCLKINNFFKAKAAEAERICEDSGKQLVSLDSKEKHDSICKHLKSSGRNKYLNIFQQQISHSGQTSIPHLTSMKLDASGKHTWKSGRDSFIKWCPQQPAKGKGECAAIVNCCVKVAECEQATQFLCEESSESTMYCKHT